MTPNEVLGPKSMTETLKVYLPLIKQEDRALITELCNILDGAKSIKSLDFMALLSRVTNILSDLKSTAVAAGNDDYDTLSRMYGLTFTLDDGSTVKQFTKSGKYVLPEELQTRELVLKADIKKAKDLGECVYTPAKVNRDKDLTFAISVK